MDKCVQVTSESFVGMTGSVLGCTLRSVWSIRLEVFPSPEEALHYRKQICKCLAAAGLSRNCDIRSLIELRDGDTLYTERRLPQERS